MDHKKTPRVFVGPVEIAGYYGRLASGLSELGLRCDFVEYRRHPFAYQAHSHVPTTIAWIRALNALGDRAGRLTRLPVVLLVALLRLLHFLGALFAYDVFIFGFGESLLPWNLDLPVLRLFGKRVLMNVAHGSEVRPPYADGALLLADGSDGASTERLCALTRERSRKLARIEASATLVIGAPYSSTPFASRPMINLFCLGIPYDFDSGAGDAAPEPAEDRGAPGSSPDAGRAMRILHSPSHPAAKGSVKIREAIERLRARGHAIDYVELRGRPNAEVIAEIRRCDFVVDQLYSDTPMAGFPAEAAWYGKPAVVGGYGIEALRPRVPEGLWPPSQICRPDEVEQAIEALITDPDRRRALGAAARKFVHEKWTAQDVARRFVRLIEGDVPAEWWLRPEQVEYHHGSGQPEEVTKSKVRALVLAHGVSALGLSHRPALEHSMLEFAGLAPPR